MRKTFATILITKILFFFVSSAFSQSIISGKVKDEKGKPLPYANIGIKGGKIGTVSTSDGKFSISLPDTSLNDSLTFSSIGFEDKSFIINELTKQKNIEVVLNEKVILLAEVKVSNTKLKRHKIGITGRTPMIYIPTRSYQKTDIVEQARLIHLKKPARILDANIYILSESMKEVSIRIRLNFYTFKNGLPGERLIEKSIIKEAILRKGWFIIDLKDEHIYLDQDFVVAFEYLPGTPSSIVYGAKIGASDSFLRSSSQGFWKKNTAGGCSIYVTAEM